MLVTGNSRLSFKQDSLPFLVRISFGFDMGRGIRCVFSIQGLPSIGELRCLSGLRDTENYFSASISGSAKLVGVMKLELLDGAAKDGGGRSATA